MGSRRWVTCEGCGAPLPRPKRGGLTLDCPWCETPNTFERTSPFLSRRKVVWGATVALLGLSVLFATHALRRPWTEVVTTRLAPAPTVNVEVLDQGLPEFAPETPFEAVRTPPPLAEAAGPPLIEPPPTTEVPAGPPAIAGLSPIVADVGPALRDRETLPPPPRVARPRNLLVGDAQGRRVIARHATESAGSHLVVLPDGQLGRTDVLVPTDAPFRPWTPAQVRDDLLAGPFQGFHATLTAHYVVVSSGTPKHAKFTADLLESLYVGLGAMLKKHGFDVHEAEFPLVAVIDRNRADFQARRGVAAEVLAYYDPITNRIYLYELAENEDDERDVVAPRQSQTVAHEGTHQVLQNNGLQPRLAPWPTWLAEGLAEYCAPTSTNADGTWRGCGEINPLHVITLRDLDDPLAKMLRGTGPPMKGESAIRRPKMEELLTSKDLRPTDYAAAWELTYYLAQKRPKDFVRYLKTMGTIRPLEPPGETNPIKVFRGAFGHDLTKIAARARGLLARSRAYTDYPYYAAIAEVWHEDLGLIREWVVSQSPALISEWTIERTSPDGVESTIWVERFPTRAAAQLWVRFWLGDDGPQGGE